MANGTAAFADSSKILGGIKLRVALIWESRSTTSTRFLWWRARQAARLTVRVVLPTPPFMLTVLMMSAIGTWEIGGWVSGLTGKLRVLG